MKNQITKESRTKERKKDLTQASQFDLPELTRDSTAKPSKNSIRENKSEIEIECSDHWQVPQVSTTMIPKENSSPNPCQRNPVAKLDPVELGNVID